MTRKRNGFAAFTGIWIAMFGSLERHRNHPRHHETRANTALDARRPRHLYRG
ncbi:hypothetical protein SAMN06295998_107121 [Primorskyibacter flagellatus]|uniref:Uncharacterized protein n=1 Tax=Primorskyibacter flagellatus TaxID=1387277 RepID=A0A1W2CE80_9RHOB|nr:hypothetical protein SAMN06295998_107121 [Primorskyibacter flagellatus]